MEAFYSSDEEVAWGPMTLKEYKGDIKRHRNWQSRYTTHCEIKGDNKFPNVTIQKEMEPSERVKEEDNLIPDISSYLTASEVGNAKSACGYQHDSLLEYHSAIEKSNNSAPESSVYFSGTDIEKSVNKNIIEEKAQDYRDVSQINFVQNAMERTCDYIFKNEYQTLIDDSLNSSDKSFTKDVERDISGSPFEISSDEGNATGEYQNLSYVQVSSEDEKNKSDKDTAKDTQYQEDIYHNTGAANCSVSSISLPEIDLQQFSESSDCPLDDTIEKINAILKQANDSYESSDEVIERDKENLSENYLADIYDPSDKKRNYEVCPESVNLISGSFLQKPVSTVKDHIHLKSPSMCKSNIPLFKKSPKSFRMPNVPSKIKTSQKMLKPNLKDIVSPVRMYINYSPNPILKQNVHLVDRKVTKPDISSRIPEIKRNDNVESLPNAFYKPSKNQILASEKHLHLPASIGKMVIKSNVIKSEKKYQGTNLFTNMSLDADCELTKTSLSESQLSESDPNVSVLYKASALRKK
ncbi:uncharacterized protein [Diabrotica undecimpunctata]|uniref:uncharacterized protein isoform X2 n=1 Tax=Diabrotica undecimpunctata TaxID=50387 RepID=UPI003B63BDE8